MENIRGTYDSKVRSLIQWTIYPTTDNVEFFEKLLLSKLKPAITKKKRILSHQFQNQHSTLEQVHTITDVEKLKKKNTFGSVYIKKYSQVSLLHKR